VKKRLAILFAVVALLTTAVMPAMATNVSFVYLPDDGGANDYPGQKDLTAQSSANDAGSFYTAWKWDEIGWNGNNTGDGCSLFDTAPTDGNADYALCGTVGKKNPVVLQGVTLYSCSDHRADRCTGPTVIFSATTTASTYCTVHDKAAGTFDAQDTQIECNISAIGAASTPPVTVIGSGTLLNTCSYPSQQPNSDPSDCVVTVPPTDTTTGTTPTGSVTWSADLGDSATVSNNGQGNVVFNLFLDDPTCAGTAVFTDSTNATDASGTASTTTNVTAAGTYTWTADFTPTDPSLFTPSSSGCGETVVVSAASATVQ
jgi:hypothetical protein